MGQINPRDDSGFPRRRARAEQYIWREGRKKREKGKWRDEATKRGVEF